MTTKPPEEGEIWEWRAFGRISDSLADAVRSRPNRLGIIDQQGEDLYFISPTSDQNVKLRRWGSGWMLKIKLLLATSDRSVELYSESSKMIFSFPVPATVLYYAAGLLEVSVEQEVDDDEPVSGEQFISSLVASDPPARRVDVAKTRSQYEFDGGWVELADVTLPRARVQSISVQSPEIENVRSILAMLEPGPELEAMNYVEACRRWS